MSYGPRNSPADVRARALTDAILACARAGDDLGDMLSFALGTAANELGSVSALVAGRPGSWEAYDVRHLAAQYAETADRLDLL